MSRFSAFRGEVGLSGLIPVQDRGAPERRRAGVAFVATWATAASVYATLWSRTPPGLRLALDAGGFATALLGILLAHELAHRAAARRRGIDVTLPLFLPAPILFGTFGALIGLRDAPRDRGALLVMAAAGPFAGLGAAGLVLGVHALVRPDLARGWSPVAFATPPAWDVAAAAGLAPVAVDPSDPLPFAAWIAVWVTGTNLLPFGQLDGGHVFGALFPAWRGVASSTVAVGLALAGWWWPGWWVWLAILVALGGATPITPQRSGAPSRRDTCVGVAVLVTWVACFSPVPFR
jgi:membrane-associated protease RseP (regulator of RpoE activity)